MMTVPDLLHAGLADKVAPLHGIYQHGYNLRIVSVNVFVISVGANKYCWYVIESALVSDKFQGRNYGGIVKLRNWLISLRKEVA